MEAHTGISLHNSEKQNTIIEKSVLIQMKKLHDQITIDQNNISRYGFACFHRKGEPILVHDYWHRTIELAVDPIAGNQILEFKIPSNYLIEFSDHEKIVNTSNFCTSTQASAGNSIELLSARAGWNQSMADLHAMIAYDRKGIFISTYQFNDIDIPLGSGVSLPVNEDLAWIGMILVHPELRRQGIAQTIMHACLAHARLKQNKIIVGLDATPLGKQVYDSLGFKDSCTIWRSIISTNHVNLTTENYDLKPFNFRSAVDYLNEIKYPERNAIIELLSRLPKAKNTMATSKQKVLGFVMSRPGRLMPFIGPLIANSPEVAKSLLTKVLNHWSNRSFEHVFIDIPEHHLNGSIFTNLKEKMPMNNQQFSVNPVRSLVRMYQLVALEEIEKSESARSNPLMQIAFEHREETAAFMQKEKYEIVPIMYGTSGPEWG